MCDRASTRETSNEVKLDNCGSPVCTIPLLATLTKRCPNIRNEELRIRELTGRNIAGFFEPVGRKMTDAEKDFNRQKRQESKLGWERVVASAAERDSGVKRAFGPGYSSDNAGDGPGGRGRAKKIQKLRSEVGSIVREEVKRVVKKELHSGVKMAANQTFGRKPKNKRMRRAKSVVVASGSQGSDLLVNSVVAHISPEKAQRGKVSGLNDPRSSQKISVKSLGTITINSGGDAMFMINPCVASDRPSVVTYVGTPANMALPSSTFTSSTVGPAPASLAMYTSTSNTPYSAATLQNNFEWRHVGTSFKVSILSNQLYQGGVGRFLDDTRGDFIADTFDATGKTMAVLLAELNSHPGTLRYNFSENSVKSYTVSSGDHRYNMDGSWQAYPAYNAANGRFQEQKVGGTTSTVYSCQPAAYFAFSNSSPSALILEYETIEHWEVIGQEIAALHTESVGHLGVLSAVKQLCSQTREKHADNPKATFANVLKQLSKTVHNKAAMQGVEGVMGAALALA